MASLMETVGAEINRALVFPLSRILMWGLNRWFPFPGSLQDVNRRSGRKRRHHVLVSLIVKARGLGKPFLELQFFFTKRRHFIAERLLLLGVSKGKDRFDKGCGFADPDQDVHRKEV